MIVQISSQVIVIERVLKFQVLAYTNSCLNPILYALVSDNFRKGFLRIICVAMNRITLGRWCQDASQLSARMELTFYNGRNNSDRLSRTNSSHRTLTNPLSVMDRLAVDLQF